MRYVSRLLVLVAAFGFCHPAQAGIFSRKPKAEPAEQVPTLIMQLKTDKDDSKRETAAEELRNFDPNAFPEIMTVLIDALTRDTATGVRVEAAASIAKLRPINQQAGFALEQAAANDPAIRVRMAARQALLQYHLVGYRSGKPQEGPALTQQNGQRTSAKHPRNESPEPPLADAPGTPSTSQKPSSIIPRLIPPPSNPKPQPQPSQPEGPSLGG